MIKENDVTLKIVQRDVDFQVIEDGVLLKTIKVPIITERRMLLDFL